MPNKESATASILSHLIGEESEGTETSEVNISKGKQVNKAIKSTNDLANHLPTGTLLLYQLLSPIVTKQGNCNTLGRILIIVLVALCCALCVLLSFTDSFKDKKGNVHQGIATPRGLWVIGGSQLSAQDSAKYKLRIIDFVHAFMTLLVFSSVALSDINVVNCFFPSPTTKTHWVLVALPVGISTVCSALFVVFPTNRRGLGFSVSEN